MFPAMDAAGMPVAKEKSVVNPTPSAVDPKVVAVIGVVVDQALGGRYRIKSITPLNEKQ
jgi:hypothetical protein